MGKDKHTFKEIAKNMEHYIAAGERNNGATFRQQWQRANDIGTKIALVVSFNEWTIGEQTSLEVTRK